MWCEKEKIYSMIKFVEQSSKNYKRIEYISYNLRCLFQLLFGQFNKKLNKFSIK